MRTKLIAYISGAIATYSLRKERGELEDQASMYDFLAKTIPNDLESEAKIKQLMRSFNMCQPDYLGNRFKKPIR